jgi:cell division protein FtsN
MSLHHLVMRLSFLHRIPKILARASFLGAVATALLSVAPRAAHAQNPRDAVAADSLEPALLDAIARARRQVADGDGAAGRALLDSLLGATPSDSRALPEVLFWRAALAESATTAARDYRRVAVEYPLSPRASDALLRLAQLELARGDATEAQRHLDRLQREHPTAAASAQAQYWLARARFAANDVPRACGALRQASTVASPSDVELRNQIEYLHQRCDGVAAVTEPAPVPSPRAVQPRDTRPNTRRASGLERPRPIRDGTVPPVRDSTIDTVRDSEIAPVRDSEIVPVRDSALAPVRDSSLVTVDARARAGRKSGGANAKPAAAAARFSIQLAAYDTRAAAQALSTKLAKRGLVARVDGSRKPYRVRVGRYATRAEAADAQRALARRGVKGIVVETAPEPKR